MAETEKQEKQTVVLKVMMHCDGCAGAVKKAINKLHGVESYKIDVEADKVTVTGILKPEEVLKRIARTGKPTSLWPEEPKQEKKEESKKEEEKRKEEGPTALPDDFIWNYYPKTLGLCP